MTSRTVRGALLTAIASIAALAALASDPPKPIPAGSTLRVRLDTLLSDKTNKSGDKFTGVVTEPIMVEGDEVVPKYSTVNGHVAFVKPSGRIHGVAQLRVVIDNVTTDSNTVYPLSGTLDETHGGVCGKTGLGNKGKADEEGTITGCGKNKKDLAKDTAIAGAIGTAAGATIGMASRGGCDYYGNCYPATGPGLGADIGIGAATGAGTALIYSLLKHEKHIVLGPGTELTFTVNRSTTAEALPPGAVAQSQ